MTSGTFYEFIYTKAQKNHKRMNPLKCSKSLSCVQTDNKLVIRDKLSGNIFGAAETNIV